MDDEEQQETGELYCWDRGKFHRLGCEAVITNGPAVTAHALTLYHVDSVNRTIWRHAIRNGASLGEGKIFLQLRESDGYPDGIVLDNEGCLWVALWDGWGVRRYSADGILLVEIKLPCARVTKIAFGGPELRIAYVTTARTGLSAAELAVQPLAGGLFVCEAQIPGCHLPAVELN